MNIHAEKPVEVQRFGAKLRQLFSGNRGAPSQLATMPDWVRSVMIAQIEDFRPDVILNQVMHFVSAKSLRSLVGKRCLLVGQIAAPGTSPRMISPMI